MGIPRNQRRRDPGRSVWPEGIHKPVSHPPTRALLLGTLFVFDSPKFQGPLWDGFGSVYHPDRVPQPGALIFCYLRGRSVSLSGNIHLVSWSFDEASRSSLYPLIRAWPHKIISTLRVSDSFTGNHEQRTPRKQPCSLGIAKVSRAITGLGCQAM
jgi:hypothetical protein